MERGDRGRRPIKKAFKKGDKPAKSFRPKPAGEWFDKPKFKKRATDSAAEPHAKLVIDTNMRLNKYLAHCGVAARRKADEIIASGEVQVNGVVVTEMGHRIQPGKDKITLKGKLLIPTENQVYILLNKPKDFITTVSDDRDRKTVIDLVRAATDERVFPVGRLDRNTTGVLLITNDGELMNKLTHPSHKVKKIYHATLDKPMEIEDMEKIAAGIKLDEGVATIDSIAYAHATDKKQIGIELHIGWNHVVKRVFEAVGYKVEKLDRVLFAGLTKKNIPRGKWRMLEPKEVAILKAGK